MISYVVGIAQVKYLSTHCMSKHKGCHVWQIRRKYSLLIIFLHPLCLLISETEETIASNHKD
jgi:hypothetical protein